MERQETSKTASDVQRIHIRVFDLEGGQQKVDVKLPVGLMEEGAKRTSEAEDASGEQKPGGLPSFSFRELARTVGPESGGLLAEVEDKEANERVEIYFE